MLGKLCRDLGRYSEAEKFLRRSIATWENLPPVPEWGLSQSLFSLGTLYLEKSQYRKAEQLLHRSMAKRIDPAAQAGFRNLLGVSYTGQRHYAKAEHALRQALAIWEQQIKPSYPSLGYSIFNNLGVLCGETARLRESLRHFERALGLTESLGFPNHPELPRLYSNLGQAYFNAGLMAESKQWFECALAMAENVLGRDHPTVADVLGQRAEMLRKGGGKREAREMEKRVRAIMGKHENDSLSRHTVDATDLVRR